MATKPWRKNAWCFRADVMCNTSTMAFKPGLYPPPPNVSPLRRRTPPLIFQRLEDTKEEHALRCHADACQKYLQSKDNVKRQCGKSDRELLMENCHLYRTRLENAELLERARGVEDCHSGEQVWAMSLREHWTVEPRIGDLYSTPICYQREGSQKEIEQIGSPYKENLHHLISDSSSPKNPKQLSTLTSYKRFLKKCEKKLAKVKVHIPEFPALEVVGTRPSANFVTKADEATEPCNSGLVVELEVPECGGDESKHGPRAELSTTTLFLHGKPGEHVRSLATLRNTGSTSLFYQWHRQPPISLLVDEPSCIVQAGDDCSRRASFFYIVPTNGCLVPGQCKEFYIEFHPCIPGSFMETWILHFSPKLVTSLPALHLRGAAAVPEDVNSTLQRKLLQLSLDTKQRSRGLEEIFGEILEKAIKEVQITFKKAPDFVVSNESFDFMRSNIECFEETPLYYNPPVHLQFQDIAAEIHTKSLANAELDSPIDEAGSNSIASIAHTWDSSVSNLILSLDDIDVNENWKEMIQHRVSCLRLQAAIPPHPTALLYTAMYKALVKIVSDVEEVMEGDCKKLGETLSISEMESSSNVELGFVKSLESSPSKETSGNANVGENSGMAFGSSSAKQTFTNATKVQQVEAMKTSESGPSRGSMGNANVGSSSSKQVVVKENVRPADSLKGSPSKQVTAGVKEGGIRENPSRETAEQAGIDEMEDRISFEERVRGVLQEGVVEGFLKNVDTAFAKLVLVVQKKIECCMAEGDEISASWLSLWFTRLSHAINYH